MSELKVKAFISCARGAEAYLISFSKTENLVRPREWDAVNTSTVEKQIFTMLDDPLYMV